MPFYFIVTLAVDGNLLSFVMRKEGHVGGSK